MLRGLWQGTPAFLQILKRKAGVTETLPKLPGIKHNPSASLCYFVLQHPTINVILLAGSRGWVGGRTCPGSSIRSSCGTLGTSQYRWTAHCLQKWRQNKRCSFDDVTRQRGVTDGAVTVTAARPVMYGRTRTGNAEMRLDTQNDGACRHGNNSTNPVSSTVS